MQPDKFAFILVRKIKAGGATMLQSHTINVANTFQPVAKLALFEVRGGGGIRF